MGRVLRRSMIPGLFTLGNLFCGFLAVTHTIEGHHVTAAWWIIIAGIFDALDGKVARLAGASSEFGIEFDSIADVVSFGMAPAALFYSYALKGSGEIGYVLAFGFLGAGAFRLARFNLSASTGKKFNFTGMPIPSGAGILASYILFTENVWDGFARYDFAMVLVLLTSLAMVSAFKYATFPRISFHTFRDKAVSTWFISHMVAVILFPDELFFITGIMYLSSGPIRFFMGPAVVHVINNVFHKADGR